MIFLHFKNANQHFRHSFFSFKRNVQVATVSSPTVAKIGLVEFLNRFEELKNENFNLVLNNNYFREK